MIFWSDACKEVTLLGHWSEHAQVILHSLWFGSLVSHPGDDIGPRAILYHIGDVLHTIEPALHLWSRLIGENTKWEHSTTIWYCSISTRLLHFMPRCTAFRLASAHTQTVLVTVADTRAHAFISGRVLTRMWTHTCHTRMNGMHRHTHRHVKASVVRALFACCSKGRGGFGYCYVNLPFFCVLEPIQTHTRACAHTHTHRHMQCIQWCIDWRTRILVAKNKETGSELPCRNTSHTHTQAHTHTHTHRHTHTHIHTHTHKSSPGLTWVGGNWNSGRRGSDTAPC